MEVDDFGWPVSNDTIEFLKKITDPGAECPKCGEGLTENYSDKFPGVFIDCLDCGFSAYSQSGEGDSFYTYKKTEGKK